jgi:hypothetical protein
MPASPHTPAASRRHDLSSTSSFLVKSWSAVVMAVARGRSMTVTWPKPRDVGPGGTQVLGHRDVRQGHGAVSPVEALARPKLVGDSRTAASAAKAGPVQQRATRPGDGKRWLSESFRNCHASRTRTQIWIVCLDLSLSISGIQSHAKSAGIYRPRERSVPPLWGHCVAGSVGAGGRWVDRGVAGAGASGRRCLGPVPALAVPHWGVDAVAGSRLARCLRAGAVYAVWA